MRLFLDSGYPSMVRRCPRQFVVRRNHQSAYLLREGLQYSIQNITRLIDTARDLNLRELQIQVTEVSDPGRHSRVHALI